MIKLFFSTFVFIQTFRIGLAFDLFIIYQTGFFFLRQTYRERGIKKKVAADWLTVNLVAEPPSQRKESLLTDFVHFSPTCGTGIVARANILHNLELQTIWQNSWQNIIGNLYSAGAWRTYSKQPLPATLATAILLLPRQYINTDIYRSLWKGIHVFMSKARAVEKQTFSAVPSQNVFWTMRAFLFFGLDILRQDTEDSRAGEGWLS